MLVAALFGALAGAMLAFPGEAADAARQALALWAGSVAPVLGPFMACMLMLSSRLGGGPWLRAALGWLCGSPGGAKLLLPLAPRGKSALRWAALSGTMSPMFFLGAVNGWLGGQGALILFCHVAAALPAGLCLPAEKAAAPAAPAVPSPLPLSAALRESASALLLIALCMMLGGAAARMAACALPFLPPAGAAALQCALEVTGGVRAIVALGLPRPAPWVCAACSFGGLSLLMQNAALWREAGVGIGQLLGLRLLHALAAFALCGLLTAVLY